MKWKHLDRRADYEAVPPGTPTPSVEDGFEKARKFSSDCALAKCITQKITEPVALDDRPFSVRKDVGFRRLIEHIE